MCKKGKKVTAKKQEIIKYYALKMSCCPVKRDYNDIECNENVRQVVYKKKYIYINTQSFKTYRHK